MRLPHKALVRTTAARKGESQARVMSEVAESHAWGHTLIILQARQKSQRAPFEDSSQSGLTRSQKGTALSVIATK